MLSDFSWVLYHILTACTYVSFYTWFPFTEMHICSLYEDRLIYIELQCAVILWSEPAQSNLYFNMSQATTNIYNL